MSIRPKFHPLVALALLAISAVLAASACGDDDDDGGPSQEDFAAQADSICADADKKQSAIKSRGTQPGPYHNFNDAAYLQQWSAVTTDAVAKLEDIEASGESRTAFDEMVTALKASLAAIDDSLKSLESGDAKAGTQAKIDYEKSYGDAQAAAGSAGLTACQGLAN